MIKVDVLSANDFSSIVNEYGSDPQKATLGDANTNWQNEIYQKAFASDNNISVSGGIKNFPYRISIGYLNQDGVLKTDNLERTSLAFVLNPTLFDNHLKINLNLKGTQDNFRFANTGAIGAAITFNPTLPIYSGASKYNGYSIAGFDPATSNPIANPIADLVDRFDESKAQRSIGNIQLDYKFHFLPDLHANLNLGYDVSKGTGTVFVSDSSAVEYKQNNPSTSGENNHYKQTKSNTLLEFYFNYVKDWMQLKVQ